MQIKLSPNLFCFSAEINPILKQVICFFISPPAEVFASVARHIFRREIQFSVPFPGYNFHPVLSF